MRNWLFDLDNTLYPFGSGLFDQVRARIGEYMTLHCGVQTHDIESTQRRYRDQYGSSLAGLMAEDLPNPNRFFLLFTMSITALSTPILGLPMRWQS